jgi:hypothetical protein
LLKSPIISSLRVRLVSLWQADVVFSPIPAGQFAAFDEPGRVKIASTLETEALGPVLTRLATETRAVATDGEARIKFRRYWRKLGIGAMLIRTLVLIAARRPAETTAHSAPCTLSRSARGQCWVQPSARPSNGPPERRYPLTVTLS